MTPVYQRVEEHDPDNGLIGDCFRAAMASMLDMRLDDVPHFGVLSLPSLDPVVFWGHVQRWLSHQRLCLQLTEPLTEREMRRRGLADQHHFIIADVEGLGGIPVGHALIGMNGRIVHDPNLTKPKLLRVNLFGFFSNQGSLNRNGALLRQRSQEWRAH